MVAVYLLSALIAGNKPVGISVKGKPAVGILLHHQLAYALRMGRAAVFVYIAAVRRIIVGQHLGSQAFKKHRGYLACRAVGAVQHYFHVVKAHIHRGKQKVHIILRRIFNLYALAYLHARRLRQRLRSLYHPLNTVLHLIRQLVAV